MSEPTRRLDVPGTTALLSRPTTGAPSADAGAPAPVPPYPPPPVSHAADRAATAIVPPPLPGAPDPPGAPGADPPPPPPPADEGRRTVRLPVLGDVPVPARRHLGTAVAALSLVPAVAGSHWAHELVGATDDDPDGDGPDGNDPQSRAAAKGVALAAGVAPEHLLARVTYGATPALRAEVAVTGMSTWLAQQLSPASVPDPEGDAVLASFPLLTMSPKEIRELRERRQGADVDAPRDLQAAHVGRALWSRRQLFEVMVNFWSDHFTVPVTADRADLLRADYDARVIRRYALGRFEDLLVGVANHPAMMLYLNLSGSTRRMPNENFARELLELHTVGVDGGYHETDVKQAAKLLTGVQVEDDLSVTYHPRDHYVGPVKVMGFTSANGSRANGRLVARALYKYLAHHPSTARFLATKLARRFVADVPPAPLVDRLAAAYLANDTRIVPVLVALFNSPEFAAAAGTKLRRPMEFVVASGRALGLRPGPDPDGLRDLARSLDDLGHAPFRWTTPNGYPDVAAAWQSAGQALNQWRLLARFLDGRDEHGVGVPSPSKLLTAPARATTPAAVADQLARRYLGRPPTAAELAAVALALPARAYPKKLKAGSQGQDRAVVNATFVLLQSATFLTR